MVDPRIVELIQGDLDGDLTASQRAELGRALLADPELHRMHAALQKTDAALKGLPDAEPPAGLRDRILGAVFPAGEPVRPVAAGGKGGPGLIRYAAVFAGGLVLASMVFYLSGPDREVNPADMAGTIAGTSSHGALAGEAVLDAGAAGATVRLYRAGRVTVLEAAISGPPGSVLEIEYDEEMLQMTGIVPGGDALDVRAGPGELVLGGEAGLRRIYFESAERGGVELDVALRSVGGDRDEKKLTARQGR